MTRLLDDISVLINKGIGDLSRLDHIKQTLEDNKKLYASDQKYVDDLIKNHLLPIDENNKTTNQNTFCTKCGAKLESDNNFCPKCGVSINLDTEKKNQKEVKPEKLKKKGRSKKKKFGIAFGVMILLFFGLSILSAIGSESNETELKNPELSPTQIKDGATSGISYDKLMRNNEKYVDNILYLEGEVIESRKTYGDTYVLRVSITKENLGFGSIFYSDPIWVNYAGDRVLEEDIVGIYGNVKGIKEYEAVLGNTISIPEVDSLLLEVIGKGN